MGSCAFKGPPTEDGTVQRVIAHTLPNTNSSTRVLEKVSMNFVGEVIDPGDGRVWQWERRVELSEPGTL